MVNDPERIMAFVQGELESSPKVSTSELFERARKAFPELAELSLRQFNARFPLQIRRRLSLARPRRRNRGGRRAAAVRAASHPQGHAAVREVFLRFAEDLMAADEGKDIVRVIGGLDQYVSDALAATTKKPGK